MSYQVYAIKTRPQSFTEVIGQEPVVSALSHALDKNKLHHAYLFTGTRGVGKTTIARIIAKSLNCQQGISSNPCNKCENCISITEGKFPDLIEIDAASKTKVEDTRSLLDTVIYSPTQGRYKIYLIDEVHMLSTHSFNALLKTLEEPPSHVKFLLATTDPHKIPATIVSRCLQFTLKWVDSEVISKHLESVLTKDNIAYEQSALSLIARAGQGSVRDSLSLLEQAVALGAGEVTTDTVRTMLGSIPGEDIVDLIKYILADDGESIINKVHELTMIGSDFGQVLSQFIYTLHQVALLQQAPKISDSLDIDLKSELKELAAQIKPEDLQIYYQIALLAKRDSAYSPQPKLAFEMALIRMLNFVPVDLAKDFGQESRNKVDPTVSALGCKPREAVKPATKSKPVISARQDRVEASNQINKTKPELETNINSSIDTPDKSNWHTWVNQLGLTGILLQIIKNTEFKEYSNNQLKLVLDNRVKALVNQKRFDDIESKISQVLANKTSLIIEKSDIKQDGGSGASTPAVMEQQQKQQKQEELVAKLQNDPNIESIMKTFNGELKLDSVEVTEDS